MTATGLYGLRRWSARLARIYYGWVIVAGSTLIMALAYGIMYSYSVFFKSIVNAFGWDRSTVSSIYSVSLVLRGAVSIAIGWLADRYGAAKLTAFCGLMMGLGLVAAGSVTRLWQFYLAYGLILSIGLSGAFSIGSAITAQWFTRRRALALAIVSTGSGLGTLLLVPLAERLIAVYNWSCVFILFGVGSGLLVTATAFLFKPAPHPAAASKGDRAAETAMTLRQAALSKPMLIMVMIFALIFFCVQMVMIHLVNYATDHGIATLQAAGMVSVIGMVSIAGRLVMGSASDIIGTHNALIVCNLLRVISLGLLFIWNSPAGLYCFAVLFGFAYGGEIPQIPLFIGQIFGTRWMAAMMGLLLFVGNLAGALGPLTGGWLFDRTGHYQTAFAIALGASLLALFSAVGFKRAVPLPAA